MPSATICRPLIVRCQFPSVNHGPLVVIHRQPVSSPQLLAVDHLSCIRVVGYYSLSASRLPLSVAYPLPITIYQSPTINFHWLAAIHRSPISNPVLSFVHHQPPPTHCIPAIAGSSTSYLPVA
ncbi:Fe2OG dioxygenase domain-containing protein [Psidium guajava]|nr:Fe2OG dioxygenase domain-containing protein [Psidium guajava]